MPVQGDYSEAFAAIDQIGGAKDQPSPKQPAKPAESKATKPVEKSDEQPPSKPAKAAKDGKRKSLGDDLDGLFSEAKDSSEASESRQGDELDVDKLFDAPTTPKQLREAYKAAKQRADDLEKSQKETSEKVSSEWREKLDVAERRRAELETELRFHNYAKSEDYKANYEKPLKDAWMNTLEQFRGLKMDDGQGGEAEFNPEVMVSLMQMPNFKAREEAQRMFGTAYPEVMEARKSLMALHNARDKALEDWRQKGSEREAQMIEQRKEVVKRWQSDLDEYLDDGGELFGNRDGDDQGNNLLSEGKKLVRVGILGSDVPEGLTSEQRQSFIMEAQTKLAARAVGFGRAIRDLRAAKAKIEALEKRLKEFEGSEPGQGGGRQTDPAGSSNKTPEDEIDALPAYR